MTNSFIFVGFFILSIFVIYFLYDYYWEKKDENWRKDHPDVILPD